MPSLHKRNDSPYWIVAYTDARGRRLKKSTKTRDYTVAKQFALDLEKAAKAKREALREKDQRQRVFSELYEDSKPPAEASQYAQVAPDKIPNRREIASILGMSQSTVSMALRGDRRISAEIRQKIQVTAGRLGYHTNAYVNVLMSRVRSGRKFSDKGTIAMLVDTPSQEAWYVISSYPLFHQGVLRRGEELGFRVETFFLRSPEIDASKIDRILYSRGIQGIILAPPYKGNRALNLSWERYASVGVGFGSEKQELDRVVFDQIENINIAFDELLNLGYRRIGTVLNEPVKRGSSRGFKWFAGFLECQDRLPPSQRISLCRLPAYYADRASKDFKSEIAAIEREGYNIFLPWFKKWRPEALLTINGFEHRWLESLGVRFPEEIGLACLATPVRPGFARIEEKAEEVGATALEVVASKIARNEHGLPKHPKITMIEGEWINGDSVRHIR